MEQAAKLSSDQLDLIYQKNWFKLFVREEFGGAEATLRDGIEQLYEASRLDGSLGWCVNLGSGASYFSGFLNEDAATELLSSRQAVFAGSGQFGEAVQIDGGYKVSGTWSKCTGSAHATAFTVNAVLPNGTNQSFVLLPSQVEIINEWRLNGLEASSSFQIKCTNAFVPEKYRFDIGPVNERTSYEIHELEFEVFARFCMTLSYLGMAHRLIDVTKEDHVLLERNIEDTLHEFEKHVLSAKKELLDLASDFWNSGHGDYDLKTIVQNTVRTTYNHICKLYFEGGLRMADLRTSVNNAYRDVMLAGQHFLLK